MPFWKRREDKPHKRSKGQKSIYASAPAIQERESSLYLPEVVTTTSTTAASTSTSGRSRRSGRGSGSGQATVLSPQRGISCNGSSTSARNNNQKPNRTLFTPAPDRFNLHPQKEEVVVVIPAQKHYTEQQLQQHPYRHHHHTHSSLSTFDLDRRPYSSATYSSTVDVRRPRSISFADRPIWTVESRSSSSYHNYSYDSEDEDEEEDTDDQPVQHRRGKFVSKARLTCQSLLDLGKTMSGALGLKGEGMKSEVWAKVSAASTIL